MKVLVTGANGQLGHDVVKCASNPRYEVLGTVRKVKEENQVQMDITDRDQVFKVIKEFKPDVVIHCAAWTDVDGAELRKNRKSVDLINREGTLNVADAVAEVNAKMIYISTDYVFDGQGTNPYTPDTSIPRPINYYGQSKLDGEFEVRRTLDKFFIVRISWVFGPHGSNFVKTMIELSKTHKTLQVINDQVGTPTYTKHLAKFLLELARTKEYGYYHVTNEGGYISWYDFAVEIFRLANIDVEVQPISTVEYKKTKAQRPLNSRLNKDKIREKGLSTLPFWQGAIIEYLEEENLMQWDK